MAPCFANESGTNGKISSSDRKKKKSKKRAKRKPEMTSRHHPFLEDSELKSDAKTKEEAELEMIHEIAAGKILKLLQMFSETMNGKVNAVDAG